MQAATVVVKKSAQEVPDRVVADHAQSFLSMRRAIGILGLTLPLSLLGFGLWAGDVEASISEFYFTGGRDLFVGTLFAISFFFLAYTGHKNRPGEFLSDRWVARVAGVAVLGVAFIPTGGPEGHPLPLAHEVLGVENAGLLHYASAAVFFICLTLFCRVLFVRHDGRMTERKRRENRIYKACGAVIAATLVIMGAIGLWGGGLPLDAANAIFWLESIGVVAFAVSWLVKGEVLEDALEALKRKTSRA